MTFQKVRISQTLILLLCALVLAMHCAAQQQTDNNNSWSSPVNLGPSINTQDDEFHFAISRDGLTAFFAAERPGGFGGHDIWYAQRPNRSSPWGVAINLGPNINTHDNEAGPELSPDEHWLFFSSAGKPEDSKGVGGNDLWAVHRDDTSDPAGFGLEPPLNLGSGINTKGSDVDATVFQDPKTGVITLYFTSDRATDCQFKQSSGNCLDVYQSTLQPDTASQSAPCSLSSLGQGCSFGAAVPVEELSSHMRDAHPSVRSDGLEIFLASNRPGGFGGLDLWVSSRPTTQDPWSPPMNLGPTTNTVNNERAPFLSADRETLYFTSDRPGGFGGNDFYMAKRD